VHESDFPARLKECIGDESVASFARRCGFSEGLIRAYLKAQKRPGMERIVRIAEVAGVTLDWLATGLGPRRRADAQPRASIEDLAGQHARRWEKIITLIEGIEDESAHVAAIEELFTRAQSSAEIADLRQAVKALTEAQKKRA